MRISFYGAAGEVTGSCYVIETARARVMVDFGLHQGVAAAERRNRRLPPIDFSRLDAVVLTHAHLDHCGRMPMLGPAGFRGRVWATPATRDLAAVILRDSAAIQSQDAARMAARRARLDRPPPTPLYGAAQVEGLLEHFSTVEYGQPQEIADGVTIRMVDAGHMLGSASVEVRVREGGGGGEGGAGGAEKVFAFSGDVGELGAPFLEDPTPLPHADVLILESTYGDRDHKPVAETVDEFARILGSCHADGGKVLVPAFAVGRTQQIVYYLAELFRTGKAAPLPVFVDSPMALAATDLYRKYSALFDAAAKALIAEGQPPLRFPGLKYIETGEQSRALNDTKGAMVIIAASGMCTGGRIMHHLKHNIWKPETDVVFVGFQGQGTLGRRIVDGAKRVQILGDPIVVKAKVSTLGGFSAHAGQSTLVRWPSSIAPGRPRVFLTHGEDAPRRALAAQLNATYGLGPALPVWGESFDI